MCGTPQKGAEVGGALREEEGHTPMPEWVWCVFAERICGHWSLQELPRVGFLILAKTLEINQNNAHCVANI
jgi:hypothetical protein